MRLEVGKKTMTKRRRKEVKKSLMFLGVLVIISLVSAVSMSYAAVDVDNIMVQNIFGTDEEGDDIDYVLGQIALSTGVMITIDEDVDEREIRVDWTEKPVTLREALDFVCGPENVWGLIDDKIVVAPIDPDSTNFQALCGDLTAYPLLYTNAEEALKMMDDYYTRLCKADKERNRIIVNAPPKLKENIKRYLEEVIDSPREKVVLGSKIVFIKKSSLGKLGFRGASFEWGDDVPIVRREFVELLTGIHGLYEKDDASRLWIAIDFLVEKGEAVVEANPSVVGEAGSSIEVKFAEKVWQYVSPPEVSSHDYYKPWDIKEIEAPIYLKAKPFVNGDMIALEELELLSSAFGQNSAGGGLSVSEQLIKTRISMESGQTLIIGGLTRQTKKNILSLLLPGKRWEAEDVEVLFTITPQLWTPELANREIFLEKVLEMEPEQSSLKKKGFIARHPFLTLAILYGIYEAVSE